MRRLLFALFCLAATHSLGAQDTDANAVLQKEFPITLEINKSSIVNIAANQPDRLSQANAMGSAPPIFGVFFGTLNMEHHWKFGCWAENPRASQTPCVDMPIGLHRARWVHNRELLEVFAYDSAGKVTLRYLDVTIDPKDPPLPDDPVQNLPTFPGLFSIDEAKRDYPLLVHVYGSVALSFPAGELPARTNCDITSPFPNRTNVNCTQYPPIQINSGVVDLDASIDGRKRPNISFDAKWRWSKCSVIGPGFDAARWKDSGHTQIILLGLDNKGKPEETGFEVR
jgi:hypothetical protein